MKKQRVNIQIIPPPIHARHLLNWIRYETKSTLDMLLEIITHIIYEAIHITQIYADILQNVFSVILDSQFRYSSRTILTLANNWTDENKLRILLKGLQKSNPFTKNGELSPLHVQKNWPHRQLTLSNFKVDLNG